MTLYKPKIYQLILLSCLTIFTLRVKSPSQAALSGGVRPVLKAGQDAQANDDDDSPRVGGVHVYDVVAGVADAPRQQIREKEAFQWDR